MKSALSTVSLAIASLALLVSSAYGQASATLNTDGQPTHLPGDGLTMRTPSYKGCFTDPGSMIDMGPYTFQALGWCQPLCIRLQKPYLAFVNGTNCLCGDNPPSGGSNKVDDSNCDTPCTGFTDNSCENFPSETEVTTDQLFHRWWYQLLCRLQRRLHKWRSYRHGQDKCTCPD